MQPRNVSQVIETATTAWKPSKIPGVQYLPLKADATERQGTFLLRMEPGVKYPRHRHPGGEEVLVLKGDMTVGDHKLKAGDFLYSPPGSIHEAVTEKGCMFLSILSKPIVIIASSSQAEYEAPPTET